MSKERFERLFPPEPWMRRLDRGYSFIRTDDPLVDADRIDRVASINLRFSGFNSRQPEIDELVEEFTALLDALDANGSCQYERLRESCRAVLAKHKGGE